MSCTGMGFLNSCFLSFYFALPITKDRCAHSSTSTSFPNVTISDRNKIKNNTTQQSTTVGTSSRCGRLKPAVTTEVYKPKPRLDDGTAR